jgi:hypothetical protein
LSPGWIVGFAEDFLEDGNRPKGLKSMSDDICAVRQRVNDIQV